MFRKTCIIVASILALSLALALTMNINPETSAEPSEISAAGTGVSKSAINMSPTFVEEAPTEASEVPEVPEASEASEETIADVVSSQEDTVPEVTEEVRTVRKKAESEEDLEQFPKPENPFPEASIPKPVDPIVSNPDAPEDDNEILDPKDKLPAEDGKFPELEDEFPEVGVPRPVNPDRQDDLIDLLGKGEVPRKPDTQEPDPDKEIPDVNIPKPVNPCEDERIELPEAPDVPEDIEEYDPDVEEEMPDAMIPRPPVPGWGNQDDNFIEEEPDEKQTKPEIEEPDNDSGSPVNLINPRYTINPIIHIDIKTELSEI